MNADTSVERVGSDWQRQPLVTLAELLAEPGLGLEGLVPGPGLSRAVSWTHSTELVDASAYLRPDELVCTVGSSLVDEATTRRFVTSVVNAHAAGICFGLGDVHDDVPSLLLDECTREGLTLLTAPHGVPFRTISEVLTQRLATSEAAARTRGEALVAELLAGIRVHSPLDDLLSLAASKLNGHLHLTRDGHAVDASGVSGHHETVTVQTDDLALTWSGAPPVPATSLLETVLRLIETSRHGRDVEEDLRRERTGELLHLVSQRLASAAALEPVVHATGLATDGVVFSAWPSGAARLIAATLGAVPALVGETPALAILLTNSEDTVLTVAETLGLTCGYSRSVPLSESTRALGEAIAAFDLAQRRGGPVGPSGLTTAEGLLAQQPSDRLTPFVDRLLEPLLQSDRERRTPYVATLRSYFDNNGSLVDTARAEFLHVNTVRHRLERIRELTGRDPFDLHDRIDLVIALWAHDHRDL